MNKKVIEIERINFEMEKDAHAYVEACESIFKSKIESIANYIYENKKTINVVLLSGPSSSLIIYSDDSSYNIKITSLSDSMECYFWNESSTSRIQTVVDFKTDSERLAIENTMKVYEDLLQSNSFVPVNKILLKKYILAAMVEQQRQNRGE